MQEPKLGRSVLLLCALGILWLAYRATGGKQAFYKSDEPEITPEMAQSLLHPAEPQYKRLPDLQGGLSFLVPTSFSPVQRLTGVPGLLSPECREIVVYGAPEGAPTVEVYRSPQTLPAVQVLAEHACRYFKDGSGHPAQLLASRPEMIAGCPSTHLELQRSGTPGTRAYIRVEVFRKKNLLFVVTASGEDAWDLRSGPVQDYFASFRFDPSAPTESEIRQLNKEMKRR